MDYCISPYVMKVAAARGGVRTPGRNQTMTTIPDKYLDLLQQKKAFASLATVMSDGSPQVTPVWFDYADGVVRVNTARGRVKARDITEGGAGRALYPRSRQSVPISPDSRPRPKGNGRRGSRAHRFACKKISRERQISLCPARRGSDHVRDRADVGIRNGLSEKAADVGMPMGLVIALAPDAVSSGAERRR